MKKILLLCSAFCLMLFNLHAQTTISNGGFEAWSNTGSASIVPTGWSSTKQATGACGICITFAPQTCFQSSTVVHSGSYSVQVVSESALGNVVNGALVTGQINIPTTTKTDGFVQDIPAGGYNMPFVGRPDSFVFWFQYVSVSGDYPSVQARLHVDSAFSPEPGTTYHPDVTYDIIARALWTGPTSSVSTWTRVSLPFTYVNGSTPQYIFITATSSGDQAGGSSGSTLYLDDMDVIYNPTLTTGTVSTGPFYVSADVGAAISVPFTIAGTFNAGNNVTAQLSDASGSFSAPVNIGVLTTTASGTVNATIPAGTPSGTGYRIRVISDNPALTAADNGSDITIVYTSNSIAPPATQEIAANSNGTTLTLTDTAGSISQDWQYATTSGGPYQMFSVDQTGLTYTPNFPTSGSYYVICITTYPGGLNDTSNEVQINTVSTSVAPTAIQSILVNVNGNTLTVTQSPAANSQEWLYATTSGGPYQPFSIDQTGLTYTPNFSAPGIYYVICVSTYPGGLTDTTTEVIIYVVATSVDPNTAQSIPVLTNGNTLTVTETPAATSRLWQYGTVSGGPYNNSLADINTTYVPNFATAGVYYVVCVSTYPAGLSVTSNEVQINVVSTDVTPPAAQNIIATQNGNLLTVNQNPAAQSQDWQYATTSGGPYQAFTVDQTGLTYLPNFTLPGTYYVICISSYAGGFNDTSNEVVINVGVTNSIAPTSTQSILVGVNGNTLTVTEIPNGTSRQWEYGTTSGGPYSPTSSADTFMTYIPNFNTAGVYYVVCVSLIDGIYATSNEVVISVGNATITTGTILGSPFLFSPNAPDAAVSVPYITSGTFNTGNIFTAQLSDASGSFSTPTNIGTVTDTTSGTIAATILHTTPAGTGYRIRVISDNPIIYGSDNGVDLIVDQFNNSIAPTAVQTIPANTNGNLLTVTPSQPGTQNWEYATTSGGPYSSFAPVQTGSTYTPNFTTPGTYYVVCISWNQYNDSVTSNEVQVIVVGNSIAPTATQNILAGVNGNTLTVTEIPNGTSRIWEYGTTSGGPYTPISLQTNLTYIPNFSSGGTYYVVCVSTIDGIVVTSNEVIINVTGVTLTTGTIIGSPFLFSPNAPDASVSVPYTTSGTFNVDNIFTAQLSDATGSFSSPTTIGTFAGDTSGTVPSVILHTTPAGTLYRIRVVASDPAVTGTDNGVDLVVDQFHNSIAPTPVQTIPINTNGNVLTVTASQPGTQNWEYATTSGGPYSSFSTLQTGATYTPNFSTPGTYYVVCVSWNQYLDSVTSNEVEIDVQNGDIITTLTVSPGNTYYVSDSADNVVNVTFSSNAVFGSNNIFTAQLSDASGSFASPVAIGTLNSAAIAPITATIPNSSALGYQYQIRVVSSSPAITGSSLGTDTIIPFSINVASTDTQFLTTSQNGTAVVATSSHPNSTYDWQWSTTLGIGYTDFIPGQTNSSWTPHFAQIGTYYVICNITNFQHAELTSAPAIVIIVTHAASGINGIDQSLVKAYWDANDMVVDLTAAQMLKPMMELINVEGQVVVSKELSPESLNRINTSLAQGMYILHLVDGSNSYTAKTMKQ